MKRWISVGVITYMMVCVIWWGVLLYQKNQVIYTLQVTPDLDDDSLRALADERSRQTAMILGEGVVLIISLLLGLYILNRSATKEIQSARQQSDFLLSVSHELKSPIAAIKLALQTLVRPGLPKEQQAKFLHSALADNLRLEKLVQNILLSANIESRPLELYRTPVDLKMLLEKLAHSYESEGVGRRFELTTDPAVPVVSIDEQGIQQAINNVIDNAIKYSKEDTPIIISLSALGKDVSCTVSNEGVAILEKERELIFEKFNRGSSSEIRKKEGTGIGLYITREIVRAHGGDISVISTEGQNDFIIRLPIDE